MGRAIVLYSSRYGATETYARWLGEELACPVCRLREVGAHTLTQYDQVFYGGGLYASGIAGIRPFLRVAGSLQRQKLAVFTVGLADPLVTDYSRVLEKNIPAALRGRIAVFHLRGAIEYGALGPVHRAMMAALAASLRRKPAAGLTDDDRMLLATYGGKVDFRDRRSLEPLLAFARR